MEQYNQIQSTTINFYTTTTTNLYSLTPEIDSAYPNPQLSTIFTMPKDLQRRSHTSAAFPYRTSQSRKVTSQRVKGPYKPRTTAWQKVNAITTFMFKEYRWTVKDFIRYFVTA